MGLKHTQKITELPRTGRDWHPPRGLGSLFFSSPKPLGFSGIPSRNAKELKLKRQSLGVLVQAFEMVVF